MNRDIGITSVHLDFGAPRRGAAAGPTAIHAAGIVAALEALGHKVVAEHEISQDDAARPGVDASVWHLDVVASACARLADTVEHSVRARHFPLILGGDHSLAIGSVAGLVRCFRPQGKELGILWVDAHADMNTPETSTSGHLHGMPLAVLLGHGRDNLTGMSGGVPAVAAHNVVLFGVRDVDAEEEFLVQRTGVRVFRMTEIDRRGVDDCLTEALDLLSGATAGIHLSFDLDACDPSVAPGVTTPVQMGLDRGEALTICARLGSSGRLSSVEFVELDPVMDLGNRTGELVVCLVESVLALERQPGLAARGGGSSRGRVALAGWDERRAGILAHSFYREMKAQGFITGDIVGFASALLGELISDVKRADEAAPVIPSAP